MSPADRRRFAWSTALVLIAVSVAARPVDQPPPPTNPASVPEPRYGAWERQHEALARRAARGDVDLLFLGDSIIGGWTTTAPAIWARQYGPRKPANFGVGGDHTQHILWRVDHGELDGLKPRVVVLLAGTNNVPHNPEDQVAEGVATIVRRIRAKLPDARVLLLGIFPRGASRDPAQPWAAPDPRVARVNARLARLDDGRMVRYLDLGPSFLDRDGHLSKLLMPDYLHLSQAGYRIWADAMEPTLWDMMADR